MIVRSKGKYQVRSMKGKLLGTHDSKEGAQRQLRAIEAAKEKSKG